MFARARICGRDELCVGRACGEVWCVRPARKLQPLLGFLVAAFDEESLRPSCGLAPHERVLALVREAGKRRVRRST